MLRHIALFKWKQAPRPDIATVERDLAALVGVIDGASNFVCGEALGLSGSTSYDFALSVDFVDPNSYQRYRNHEAHQRLLHEVLLPASSSVAAVQFVLPSP